MRYKVLFSGGSSSFHLREFKLPPTDRYILKSLACQRLSPARHRPNKSFPRQHYHIASQTQSSSVTLRRTSVSPYKPFDQEERSGGHKRQGLVMSHSSTGWSPNWRHTPTSSNRPSKATVRPVLPVPPYDGGDDYRIFHCLVLEEPSTIECLRGQATLPSVR